MKGYPWIWILALAAFIFTATTPVYASDIALAQLAAVNNEDEDKASEASNSDAETESDDTDSDQANQDTADNSDDGTNGAVTEPVETRLIDVVKVVVQNSNDEAVEEARIELSAKTNGDSFKKLTDDEGIARFEKLPAEQLNVKVTAPGYRSYRGEFDLGSGDNPIVIKMRKRD